MIKGGKTTKKKLQQRVLGSQMNFQFELLTLFTQDLRGSWLEPPCFDTPVYSGQEAILNVSIPLLLYMFGTYSTDWSF